MKKVIAYRSKNHALETDPLRATAWDLTYLSKESGSEISFTAALWILNNQETITQLFAELKKELNEQESVQL